MFALGDFFFSFKGLLLLRIYWVLLTAEETLWFLLSLLVVQM